MPNDFQPSHKSYAGILAMLDEPMTPEEIEEERQQYEELTRLLRENPLSFREPFNPEALKHGRPMIEEMYANMFNGPTTGTFSTATNTTSARPDSIIKAFADLKRLPPPSTFYAHSREDAERAFKYMASLAADADLGLPIAALPTIEIRRSVPEGKLFVVQGDDIRVMEIPDV